MVISSKRKNVSQWANLHIDVINNRKQNNDLLLFPQAEYKRYVKT